MAEKAGLPAIAEELGAGEVIERQMSDAEQLTMLGLELPSTRRAAGRPTGRRNLRNQRIADYLLSQYRDPLEGLVQMAGLSVGDLAAALGCTKLEAWQEKRQCAAAALPYLHQRQALAVDLTARQAVYLSIVEDADDAREAASDADRDFVGAGLVLGMEGDDVDTSD